MTSFEIFPLIVQDHVIPQGKLTLKQDFSFGAGEEHNLQLSREKRAKALFCRNSKQGNWFCAV